MRTSINLCLLTFRRPDLFRESLSSALVQKFRLCSDVDYTVTVIDNDPSESARPVFEELVSDLGGQARYVAEPRPGIPMARNRALEESAAYDFIGFLDDDETVADSWMDFHLHTMRFYKADITTGPVVPKFESAPQWVIDGKFFAPYRVTNGEPPMFVSSNNVLMKTSLALRFRFHEGLLVGEDTHYFMQLANAGGRAAWCAEAQVLESIPRSRSTKKWLIERSYSEGTRFTTACLMLFPGFRTIRTRFVKGIGMIGAGLAMLVISFRTHSAVAAIRLISRGLGTVSALLGRQHDYYKNASAQ